MSTPVVHPFVQPAVDIAVTEVKGDPTAPTVAQLLVMFQQQAGIINAQSATIQQQQATINAFPQMLASALTDYNTTVIAPLTATIAAKADAATVTTLTATVTGKASAASVATLQAAVTQNTTDIAGKVSAAALTTLQASVTQNTTDIANRLPLSGGTLTGALNVMAPTTAANPLQFSALPLTMTVNQTLPLVALGSTYSFTVTVANAVVGQVVVINGPAALVTTLSFFDAVVTAANTVTVYLKAGLAIAAGAQTFYLRVLR